MSLLVLFPGALPLASAGVGGFSYIFHFFGGHLGANPPGFLSQALLSIPLGSHILAPLGFLAPKLVTRLLKLHGHEKLSGEARKADLG